MPNEIVVALVVAVVAIAIFLALKTLVPAPASARTQIVLTGAMGAGKTALLQTLERGIFAKTVTSIAPNSRAFVPSGLVATPATQAWTYADIPGHGSFGSHLSAALAAARAVVFVVDSSDQSMWPQVAARLYAILTNPAIAKPAVPVIVVCNKVDLMLFSDGVTKVKAALEAELDKLRKVNETGPRAQMETLGGAAEAATMPLVRAGAKAGAAFKFDAAWSPVSIVPASAKAADAAAVVRALAEAAAAPLR